jgi:hypothetical protein
MLMTACFGTDSGAPQLLLLQLRRGTAEEVEGKKFLCDVAEVGV